MGKPLAGIRVLEVASHVFVPIGGAVLTEWGAEVIKVEHPETGDPYRSLVTAGLHTLHDGIDPSFQFTNRGKRSVAIDLKHPEGRAILYRLVRECDVFLTNMRPQARRRLQIDVDRIRAENPAIIYVRGSGYGPRGPDAETAGYDATGYWSRAGLAAAFTPPGAERPTMQRPAFGDVVGGLTIAGAISTALYQRLATGEAPVVDVSLLAMGMWQLQPDITHAPLQAGAPPRAYDRRATWNPISGAYRTRDGRFLQLNMLDADNYWPDLCRVIGHPELIDDPRFVDMAARKANAAACVDRLDEIFAGRDFDDWRAVLQAAKGAWAPMLTPLEVHADEQVRANGYLAPVEMANGGSLALVPAPVQFDERSAQPVRAPELGEHTEAVLLDLGIAWDEIAALKEAGAIG
ncbi:MAG: CoA transferase [Sphingomonadales bacterium]|nr:CoA transferase [Sphingomonadales bacterium]